MERNVLEHHWESECEMLEESVKDDVCVGVVFVHFPVLFFI